MFFPLKDIVFLNRKCRIVLQNENGPCPLLALANVMSLQNRLELTSLPGDFISIEELLQLLAEVFLDTNSNTDNAQHQNQMDSVLTLLPKLAKGLDLNIKFSDIDGFEYTEELTLFDALGVSIFHGWVVDPSDDILTPILSNLTYNQAMIKLVECNNEVMNTGDSATHGFLINAFMQQTQAQISFYGLARLYEKVRSRQLAVLFHNNHFSVLFKLDLRLYLLITDVGFSDSHCCWELLDEIDGDTVFADADFKILNHIIGNNINSNNIISSSDIADPYVPMPLPSTGVRTVLVEQPVEAASASGDGGVTVETNTNANSNAHEEDQDEDFNFALALKLQDEEDLLYHRQGGGGGPGPEHTPGTGTGTAAMTDYNYNYNQMHNDNIDDNAKNSNKNSSSAQQGGGAGVGDRRHGSNRRRPSSSSSSGCCTS